MNQHLSELNEVDYSNISKKCLFDFFNSRELVFLKEMNDTEFLEITNIVGIAVLDSIDDQPDLLLYLAQPLYPGCHISISYIIAAKGIIKSQHKLMVPGLNKVINNYIPILTDKIVYDF